jgi:hypothetical protein
MKTSTADSNDDQQVAPSATSDRPSETERTVSGVPQCKACLTTLMGRRSHARYCSDACRTGDRRSRRAHSIAEQVRTLERSLANLKAELGLTHE